MSTYINQIVADHTKSDAQKLTAILEHVHTLDEQNLHLRELQASRFISVTPAQATFDDEDERGPRPSVHKVLEREISYHYDMQDAHGDTDTMFYYVEDDGSIHLVTPYGAMTRHEPDPDGNGESPFNYGSSALVANGKTVGYIQHTDH